MNDLALVLIKLQIKSSTEPNYLTTCQRRWSDLPFIGGPFLPGAYGDWAAAARKECETVLHPLKYGKDFYLLPIFSQPLQLKNLRTQVFTFRFQQDPETCLRKLPKEEVFRVLKESSISDRDSLEFQIIARTVGTEYSWDAAVPEMSELL